MEWWERLGPEISAWLEEAYPDEGCGLLLRGEDGVRFMKCENLANKYHELDPESYPRTARTFYIINPIEFMRAEERGEEVVMVVHSHADVGDYFSDEDVAGALLPQFDEDDPREPSHPGVGYLVVSVREAGADHATLFEFDDDHDRGFADTSRWSVLEGVFTQEP